MLYFSKLRIIVVSLISLFFILIASANFFKFENNLLSKKINLGLDLQGGSTSGGGALTAAIVTQSHSKELKSAIKVLKMEHSSAGNLHTLLCTAPGSGRADVKVAASARSRSGDD